MFLLVTPCLVVAAQSCMEWTPIKKKKEPTCYKNPYNPSYIDLFLTNRPRTFQCTTTIETGISDFHKLVVTASKISIRSKGLKAFITGIIRILRATAFSKNDWSLILQMLLYQNLMALCYLFLTSMLQKKKKYLRSNNCNFKELAKVLRKAIMNRSKQLRNKFLKTTNEESKRRLNRQRNFCVTLLRKTKRRFFWETRP